MRNMIAVAAMVGLVVGGCASGPRRNVAAQQPKEAREIAGRLLEIMDACEKKDFVRLESYHLYGPKFTKFSTESAGRLDAESARKGERDGLSAVNGLSMGAVMMTPGSRVGCCARAAAMGRTTAATRTADSLVYISRMWELRPGSSSRPAKLSLDHSTGASYRLP